MSEKLIDVNEAAEILNLHPQTVRAHIKKGLLPAYWLGGRIRLKESEIMEALEPVEPEESDD